MQRFETLWILPSTIPEYSRSNAAGKKLCVEFEHCKANRLFPNDDDMNNV